MLIIYMVNYRKKDGTCYTTEHKCHNVLELVEWAVKSLPDETGEEFSLPNFVYGEGGYVFEDGEDDAAYRGRHDLDETFCEIKWCVEDLLCAMARNGIELSDENLERAMLLGNRLQDRSIEEGWETLDILLGMEFG